jgi:hypothetical protein
MNIADVVRATVPVETVGVVSDIIAIAARVACIVGAVNAVIARVVVHDVLATV